MYLKNSPIVDITSVKSFGAKGNGIADDTDSIQKALNSGTGCIILPTGNYKITSPLVIPPNVQFVGQGRLSNLVATNIVGGVIRTRPVNSSSGPENQRVSNINISGTADVGIVWHGSVTGKLEFITLKGLTATTGFDFYYTYGCVFDTLLTNGAIISENCFRVRAAFNANTCNNWYTSNNNCLNGILMDNTTDINTVSPLASSGNTWNTPTLQGTRYGIFAKVGNCNTFNSIYTENVVTCIKLGDKANENLVNGIVINAPLFGIPQFYNSYYGQESIQLELDYVWNCTVNSPSFVYDIGTKNIVYNNSYKTLINQGYVQGNPSSVEMSLANNISRRSTANSDSGVTIIGNGATNKFELTAHCAGYGYKHYTMSINASGAWVPVELVIPQI